MAVSTRLRMQGNRVSWHRASRLAEAFVDVLSETPFKVKDIRRFFASHRDLAGEFDAGNWNSEFILRLSKQIAAFLQPGEATPTLKASSCSASPDEAYDLLYATKTLTDVHGLAKVRSAIDCLSRLLNE